jgi:hypothetical protein
MRFAICTKHLEPLEHDPMPQTRIARAEFFALLEERVF